MKERGLQDWNWGALPCYVEGAVSLGMNPIESNRNRYGAAVEWRFRVLELVSTSFRCTASPSAHKHPSPFPWAIDIK